MGPAKIFQEVSDQKVWLVSLLGYITYGVGSLKRKFLPCSIHTTWISASNASETARSKGMTHKDSVP
jgi:hypothetical protein